MKKCTYTPEKINKLVSLTISSEGSPEEFNLLSQHLRDCEVCREKLHRIKYIFSELTEMAKPDPLTPREIARLRGAVFEGSKQNKKTTVPDFSQSFVTVLLKPLAIAICAIFIIFAGWKIYREPALHTAKIQQEKISEEEVDIISHLDMLKDLETIEKLVKVLDEPPGSRS